MTTLTDDYQPHLDAKRNPLGKNQKIFSSFVMLFIYQTPLISSIGLLIYSIIFFDFNIWLIFTVIIVLQFPIRRSQTYLRFVKSYVNPWLYFKSFKRIFQQQIPKDQNKCLFSFHPHGVIAIGLLANMNYDDDALSRMVGLGSRFILNMPITGLLLRVWGVQAVDPKNLKNLMINNENIGLLPGGFEQATLTSPKQMRIYIENRKGFIKYALKYNYTIYPTIVLNQHQAFWTFDYFIKARMLLNKIKIPSVLFFNPKTLLFYPPTIEFITVIGKGLKGKQYREDQQPTPEQIDQMHKQYIQELKRIYNKHKDKNGNKPLVMY